MAPASAVEDEQPNKRQRLNSTNGDSDRNIQVISIRTVYIRIFLHEPQSIDKAIEHFGQFGKIESVSTHFEGIRTRWCLVHFKQAKDAEEALLRTGNKWNRCDVKAADPWHQPDHPLQVAPEQDSDSNISVALNDDCLLDIFKRLELRDLTNVAGVCKRFNAQAKIIFALKHKRLELTERFGHLHGLIETAMKNFGIQSLRIALRLVKSEEDALRMIGQNCGPKLKYLELHGFRFRTDSSSLRSIFAQIEQLHLHRCTESILLKSFPKLQELPLNRNGLSDETFEDFVSRHPTLIKLSIEDAELTPRLLQAIGQHARNLQELKLFKIYSSPARDDVQFQNEAACIGQLSSLKKLQLYFRNQSIIPVLDALIAQEVPIECVNVSFTEHVDFDRAIKCISQIKQTKMLQKTTTSWTRRVTDEDAVELSECLPELEELHLEEFHLHVFWENLPNYEFRSQLSTIGLRQMLMRANKLKLLTLRWIDSIKIDVDNYMAMLYVVQKRKDEVPLVIEIYGGGDQFDVPAPLLAKNRSTLNIIISKH